MTSPAQPAVKRSRRGAKPAAATSDSITAPVTGWFRRLVCAAATRIFGERALKEVGNKPWGGLALGIAIFSFCADFSTYFVENAVFALFALSVIALIAFTATASRRDASITPAMLSLVGVVLFGGVLLAQTIVGSARGAAGGSIPVVASWQDSIGQQLDRIEGGLSLVSETTERTEIKVEALTEEVRQLILLVRADAEGGGLSESALIALAQRIDADIADPNQARVELEYAVSVAIEVAKEGRAGGPDPAVGEVKVRIAELQSLGDLDAAATTIDKALALLEAREVARRETSSAQLIEVLRVGVQQDLLRRDPLAAAARVIRIAELEHGDDAATWLAEIRKRHEEWLASGLGQGIVINAEVAIAIVRAVLVRYPDAGEPRAVLLGDLAKALSQVGDWKSENDMLVEATKVFEEQLALHTREGSPSNWVGAKSNLGLTLLALGARETGSERIREAVARFNEAAEVADRSLGDGLWGMVQQNLATSLLDLGERENDPEPVSQAIEIYDALIGAYPKDSDPDAWWNATNNLGNALRVRAYLTDSSDDLRAAIEVHTAARDALNRNLDPVRFAMAQNNLGNSLGQMSMVTGEPKWLEEAIAGYEDVAQLMPRDQAPFQWATTEENLAIAYHTLYFINRDPAALAKARVAIDGAIEEYQKGASAYLQQAQEILAEIEKLEAER